MQTCAIMLLSPYERNTRTLSDGRDELRLYEDVRRIRVPSPYDAGVGMIWYTRGMGRTTWPLCLALARRLVLRIS